MTPASLSNIDRLFPQATVGREMVSLEMKKSKRVNDTPERRGSRRTARSDNDDWFDGPLVALTWWSWQSAPLTS